MNDQDIELNKFQERVLGIPEELDLFLGGGRGGGKSYALCLLALRHIAQYGKQARILYLRKTYKGVADFEMVTREVFGPIYDNSARYNQAEHVWKFAGGGYLELGQLETQADYQKYQGRSFTLIMVDEAGQYPDPAMLDILRSNMRGPKHIPVRMIVSANPGGPGHYWIARRYVFTGEPWHMFAEEKSKRNWVYCPSTFDGNHFIDREQYADQLQSACPDDPELLRAWVKGDWAVNRGAYFAAVLEEGRNAVEPWKAIPDDWDTYLAHDFGSTAPSATYVCAVSPGAEVGGRYYPRNSIVLVDELATVRGERLNSGLGWTVPVLADAIHEMCDKWDMHAQGVADDAIFANTGHGAGSIADEFSMARVHFVPAKKADRISGWQRMKRLLQDAGKPDKPGLYISRECKYFWATVPHLPRDQKRVEDVDSTGPDHAADAVRYGCLRQRMATEIHMRMAT